MSKYSQMIASWLVLLVAVATVGTVDAADESESCFEMECDVLNWRTIVKFKNHDQSENLCRSIQTKEEYLKYMTGNKACLFFVIYLINFKELSRMELMIILILLTHWADQTNR